MSKIELREGLRIEGHRGTWYVIDEKEYDGKTLYLLEHETYGDEAASIIIDEDRNLVMSDVWNGFDDYEEAMELDMID